MFLRQPNVLNLWVKPLNLDWDVFLGCNLKIQLYTAFSATHNFSFDYSTLYKKSSIIRCENCSKSYSRSFRHLYSKLINFKILLILLLDHLNAKICLFIMLITLLASIEICFALIFYYGYTWRSKKF